MVCNSSLFSSWLLHKNIKGKIGIYVTKYIKNCWVRLLSNYNIKYICTIYTRLGTCLISISRLSLRDKVTLWLLKLHLYGADVVELCRALDLSLSDWCCSVSMVWVQIPSRGEKHLTAQKYNSNTVWYHFQMYIILIFSINLESQIALRSSGTYILYGRHLLRRLYNILYFLWLYNEFFIILYNILIIAELDCCQIIILSIYVPSTRAEPHVLCLSLYYSFEKRKHFDYLSSIFIERMWSSVLGRLT
jgi:hypothetical protein